MTGQAKMEFHERTTLMTGTIERIWNGGVTRMTGMEGIICAGAFLRAFGGPSLHVTALASGDVYGGVARVSALRLNMAGLGYRSSDSGVQWATGVYIRSTNFTIEPALGTPSQTPMKKSWASKIGKILFGICPFFEILSGVFSLLVLMPLGLIVALINKLRRKPPKPPVPTVPRTRMRVAGISSQTFGAMMCV